uniref:site-specific DNA-methyltransferase (adenine-specific) n=1 Tax=Thermocrinis ruber TaxID=75906 RepID=A0A7C5X4G7_9AQUI
MKNKKERFYQILRDLFVGEVKIEGKGGYINLLRIKSKYYEKVKEEIDEEILKVRARYPDFEEELYDKLYTFFKRYISESGAILFNQTPFHNNVYEKIYTDDEDVVLFWKTKNLYYVKTDRVFRSMPVEFDGLRFFFDAEEVEYKKNNEKREVIYELQDIENGVIVFKVKYSEKGRKTNTEEILKNLKKAGLRVSEEQLQNAFRIFEKQSEVDYFINKNAREFLKEQFKLWLYQYLVDGTEDWPKERIDKLNILRNIAYKLIDLVAQFEEELVKIWNKPKFVINSNYVITLDRIAKHGEEGLEVIRKILNHPNLQEQIREWKELGIVDDSFRVEDVLEEDRLSEEYQFLPVDTKYFKDLELEIIGLFDNLDQALDGWLIKSENYQALNTILNKFREKVQTIYIDPPFNKEQDADYLYIVKYKDSTWITMLENRLRLAKELLNERGSIFVRCDYNGNMYVRLLMNEIFGEENFRNEIKIAKSKEFYKTMTHIKKFSEEVESLFFFSKTDKLKFNLIYRKKEQPSKYEPFLPTEDKNYQDFRIINGKEYWSPKGRKWGIKQEEIDRYLMEGRLKFEDGKWYLYTYEEPLKDVWTDYQGYSKTWGFDTENSEIFIKRVVESTSNEGDLVMDFFLGSGTTTAVAHKLKRKWIGVEMGEHFWTVVLPRMKKVLAYDKSGISKEKDVKDKYNERNAGGFFKYYELEQFEDTLAKVVYEDFDPLAIKGKGIYEQYIFMRDKKMLDALELDYEKGNVRVDLSKLYDNIDIAETLSNLLGKWIKRITKDSVEFEDGTSVSLAQLDYKLIKPLIWW